MCMKYDETQLKQLQKVELDILIEVIRVCKENGLNYFTVGGTTLGAIRHNGFIPWDDDIDIGMMREDYEKFLRIAPLKLSKGFTLQSYSTEPNMPTYFAKVRKDDTLFVEDYARDIQMHQGIYIDIMPYDKIPEDLKERAKYRRKVQFWNQLFIAKSITETSVPYTKNKGYKNVLRKGLHVAVSGISKETLYHRLDSELRKYNQTESTMVSSRGLSAFETSIDDYFPLCDHVFETISVKIPRNADMVLKTQYGDYMKLPPEEKRYSHAPVCLKL